MFKVRSERGFYGQFSRVKICHKLHSKKFLITLEWWMQGADSSCED